MKPKNRCFAKPHVWLVPEKFHRWQCQKSQQFIPYLNISRLGVLITHGQDFTFRILPTKTFFRQSLNKSNIVNKFLMNSTVYMCVFKICINFQRCSVSKMGEDIFEVQKHLDLWHFRRQYKPTPSLKEWLTGKRTVLQFPNISKLLRVMLHADS